MEPQTLSTMRDVHNPLTQDARGGGTIANVPVNVNVNLGKETLVVVVMLALVIGACGVIMGLDISSRQADRREFDRRAAQSQREEDRRAEQLQREVDERAAETNGRLQDLQRQYRMTELKLDDWTVVAHRSGLVLPGDYTRGPQGNLDSESFTKPKGRK
jgi:Tfp pilus assembly protein PilN